MKCTIALLLALLSFCTAKECTVYKMANDSVEEGICSIRHKEGNVTEFYLKKCPTGYKCSSKSDTIQNCEAKYSLKLPGENCNFHFDCYSGSCIENKCVAKEDNKNCESKDWECGTTSFCNQYEGYKCKPLGDSTCKNDEYCLLGMGCLKEEGKEEGHCTKMFSLEDGSYSNANYLCKSGYRYNSKCASTSRPKDANEANECNEDSDCKIIVTLPDGNYTIDGECQCTLEGKKYCQRTSNSDEWKNYVSTFNKEIEKIDTTKVHVSGQRNIKGGLLHDWGSDRIKIAYKQFDVTYKGVNSDIIEILGSSWINYSAGLVFLLAIIY